ncbi:MAG: ABC transporter ATP-binding protein [Holophagaceae bacterium]|nr:ABC transporter ATP-binding protein [Holophagaceae bacterium]
MFQAQNLKKRFGAVQAVDGVSFAIQAGETVGLLGPNGAGKTTIVSMIAGLLTPDSGEIRLEGRAIASDTDPVKRAIGFVPQDLALFEKLGGRENLALFGALYGLKGAELDRAVDMALGLVGLADRQKDAVEAYSGGMKRRLNLAAALLHDPKLLILDEPTVGVDPQSRNAIFDNLEALKQRGLTLIYTTHYMEEAERLCDRLVIVDHGRVLKDGTLQSLYAELPAANLLEVEIEGDGAPLCEGLRCVAGVASAELRAGRLAVGVDNLAMGSAAVLAWLAARGVPVLHLASERATLEAVFLNLTGRSLRDA